MPMVPTVGTREYTDYMIKKMNEKSEESKLAKQLAEQKLEDDRRTKLTTDNQTAREADLASGRARGEELFSEGALGRVSEPRSQAITDIIARRQAESNGFTPQEQNAFRDEGISNSNQSLAGKLRILKTIHGSSGVRGNVAAAQRAKLLSDSQNQNAAIERDLFLKNIDAKRTGLNALEASTSGADKGEFERQAFNIGQKNREKFGTLASELGYGALGAGERSAISQQLLGEKQARSLIESASESGGGLCCFIFLEARYGDGTIDEVVRKFRDEKMDDVNRRGYYKLSEVLVPLMRKSRITKILVRIFLTDPCVSYGKYYYNKKGIGWVFKPLVTSWLKLFEYLGGNHPFVRENGEVV